jgi:hypothetical protein
VSVYVFIFLTTQVLNLFPRSTIILLDFPLYNTFNFADTSFGSYAVLIWLKTRSGIVAPRI